MFWLDRQAATGEKVVTDGDFIRDMVIPLTVEEATARGQRFGLDVAAIEKFEYVRDPEAIQGLFTCRHWDEETRLCGAYEARPAMCRDYPYGKGCSHGCSYEITDPDTIARYAPKAEGG